MAGIAAAAAGMVIGTAAKMVGKLKLAPEAIVLLLLAAFAAAWLRLPLPLIVLALAPISIAASLWRAGLILRSESGAMTLLLQILVTFSVLSLVAVGRRQCGAAGDAPAAGRAARLAGRRDLLPALRAGAGGAGAEHPGGQRHGLADRRLGRHGDGDGGHAAAGCGAGLDHGRAGAAGCAARPG